MSIVLATNCLQIEMAVHDVPAACAEMERLLGAVPIEQEVVKRITGVVLDIDHRGCGDAMFQFCSPLIEDIPAAHELRRIGPCVTNLTFFVEDAAGAQRELEGTGATTRAQWRTTGGSWLALLGEGNARAPEDLADGYFVGSRSLFGFDFEFSEPPWFDETKQRYMHPAFTYPRPPDEGRVGRLLRLRVLVEDLDRYLGNLLTLIDPSSRTDVYDRVDDDGIRSGRVALRGLELEYVQPTRPGPLAERLAAVGPGITTAVFEVADPGDWPALSFERREVLGFDVELEPTGGGDHGAS